MTILVLAGTRDGRRIAEDLHSRGFLVYATTVTGYGAGLFKSGLEVVTGALSRESLSRLIKEKNIEAVVDATHPFAKDISVLAIGVCDAMNIRYVRYEREKSEEGSHNNILRAKDYDEAGKILLDYNNIFLTIGSRNLHRLTYLSGLGKEITVRVLPNSEVLKNCEELGFTPDKIIAMQGPFSSMMNQIMFQERGAEIVVTKDSGIVGGVLEKIEAAQRLHIPVLLIERPKIDYPGIARDMREIFNRLNPGYTL